MNRNIYHHRAGSLGMIICTGIATVLIAIDQYHLPKGEAIWVGHHRDHPGVADGRQGTKSRLMFFDIEYLLNFFRNPGPDSNNVPSINENLV